MVECRDGDTGQQFTMGSDGLLTPVSSKTLAVGAGAAGNALQLTEKGDALRFTMDKASGNLRFAGGCAQSGACGHGNFTCLDSHCGNGRGGDCQGGAELFACCPPQACQCNQMWAVAPVKGAHGVFTITNGGAAAGKPDCHRTQGCLAVCA